MEEQIISWKVQKYRRCQRKRIWGLWWTINYDSVGILQQQQHVQTGNLDFWSTHSNIGEESLVTLFKVFVRPHLQYCIQACTPTLRRDIETLEKVQRRATKLVPSLRNLPYEDRLRRLNLPTLQDLETTWPNGPSSLFYNEGRCHGKGKHKGAPSKDL